MKYIIGTILLLIAASTFAANGPLPELTLADQSGAPVNQLALKRPSNWVLLVVDANNRMQTQSTLMRLQKKDGDWFGSLAVVVLGNQAAFDSLVANNEKLVGVRWYRDAGNLLKTLSLPGVPAALGMTPDNLINWRSIGLPEQVEKAQSLVGSWVSMPAVAPAAK